MVARTPIGLIERRPSYSPIIPYYHLVSDMRIAHVCHLYSYKNESNFIKDIEFLCARYRPISIIDLVNHVKYGKKIVAGSFLLTFDDGYSQMYSVVAPILIKKGIPAVFFLNTAFIDNKSMFFKNKASLIIEHILSNGKYSRHLEHLVPNTNDRPYKDLPRRILSLKHRQAKILDDIAELIGISFNDYLRINRPYLDSSQIRKIIDMGFDVGSHSIDHPHYANLSLEEQLYQTIRSTQLIKTQFSPPFSLFAFPHNDHYVERAFFEKIRDQVDLTFGTDVNKKRVGSSDFHRINFEYSQEPAKNILVRYYIKSIVFRFRSIVRIGST